MKYHKYDPETLLYTESVECETQPGNSVPGPLPEQTEHYTIAFKNDRWMSVLRPGLEIVDNQIREVPKTETPLA